MKYLIWIISIAIFGTTIFGAGYIYSLAESTNNTKNIEEEFDKGKEFILFGKYKVFPIKGHENRWHYKKEVK